MTKDRFVNTHSVTSLTLFTVLSLAFSTAQADDLDRLMKEIVEREQSVRRISYDGVVRVLERRETAREADETNEAFIKRYTSLEPRFSGVKASLTVQRDIKTNRLHVKYGDALDQPMFTEYFFDGRSTAKLMDTSTGQAEPSFSRGLIPELRQASEMMPRLDILAFRPISDRPLAESIAAAERNVGFPDPGGRKLFQLSRRRDSKDDELIATLRHEEPAQDRGFEILWFRVFWKSIGDQLVVARVDELSAIGKPNSMPSRVSLLEDFRKVDGVLVPNRVRRFVFGNTFLLGTVFDVDNVQINDKVSVPTISDARK